ncbi:hypothetical protein VCCP1050_2698, partial [Vibrio cholerae CP1050(23)]
MAHTSNRASLSG